MSYCASVLYKLFLSTLSLRRATGLHFPPCCLVPYFYPRSPCGERRFGRVTASFRLYFYPRSPCGERPGAGVADDLLNTISIHALLAESDAR